MPNSSRSIYDYYNITEIIGEGTFSTITLANDIFKIEDKYAIKIISKEVLDKERRTYIDWEISILSKCQHPNIIKFFEHFESDEDICLVLEWIPAGDLFDRIVRGGVFSEEEARLTMKSLLFAVEYLHDRSIVHRDIKPENILYSDSMGGIKLGDFGFAKYYEESIGLETQCGTPAYSAPEITANQVYRKSVDMWSCGCILYFILYGRPPFYSDDEEEMYDLITKGEWSFPTNAQFKHSDQVKDLIKSLLENDPNKRLTAKQSLKHKWILEERTNMKSFSKSPSPLLSSTATTHLEPITIQSSSSSSSLKTIIEQQEYNYNHQQLQHHNILHSSNNSHSRNGQHASSANCTTLDHQQEEDSFNNHQHHIYNSNNTSNNNNINNINNNNNSNNNNNNHTPHLLSHHNHHLYNNDEIEIEEEDEEEEQQPSNSLRSPSKPISIKKSQIRTSLNTSIDFFRGNLTPL